MRMFDVEPIVDTDDWHTPPWVFEDLGATFDMDVASPPGGVPWIPAARYVTETEDGLSVPWSGFVWCNPPYSAPTRWLDRMVEHGDGLILVRADLSSGAYWRAWCAADAAWFPKGRLEFVNGHGGGGGNVTFSTCVLGFGVNAVAALDGMPGARALH